MRFKSSENNAILYIIIAVLCLLNLFFGVKIIKKINNNKTEVNSNYQIDIEEEGMPVFNNIDENSSFNTMSDDLTFGNVDIQEDNIYIRIFSSSNIYMKRAYDVKVGNNSIIGFKGLWSRVSILFEPKAYFKSQLPAIFKVFDATTASGSDVEVVKVEEDKNEVIVLEDIVFIEDPVEQNEGETQLQVDENVQVAPDSFQAPNPINLDHENPYILIYHTHGTEAYLPVKTGRFHTDKRQYNVITIGEIIGGILSENGHKLKHVDIYHDIPSYDKSYIKSLSTAKEEINKNKSIKIIFDVHRDGVEETASYIERAKEESKVIINGKEVATFSLVIGPENPNKEQLTKFARYIKAVSDKMYPGLCKGIIIKPYGKFNQYISDYYALLEVGSNLNTIDEAKESAKLIGEILNEVVEGIKSNP